MKSSRLYVLITLIIGLVLGLISCEGPVTPPTVTPVPDPATDTPEPVVTDTVTPTVTTTATPTVIPSPTFTPTPTSELPAIPLPSVEEIALFSQILASENLPRFFSPPISSGRPSESIIEQWVGLAAELDLQTPSGSLSEILLGQIASFAESAVNYETAVTYSQSDQGTLYQAAPLTNDFLAEIGYAEENGSETPFLPVPVGILVAYQSFPYLGNELVSDYYLVIAGESGLLLLGANSQNIVEGSWLLRGGINPSVDSFSMLTNDRLCYTVLQYEICTLFDQPGSAAAESHAEIIQNAVNDLANGNIYIDPLTVNYESALPKLVAVPNSLCAEGPDFEIASECMPNIVLAAINTPPIFQDFPVPDGIEDIYPAIAVVAVLESVSGPVVDENGELIMELPTGSYRLDLIQGAVGEEEPDLGQLVAADGTRFYVPATRTDLGSRFIASYGTDVDEGALPSDVYLAGYTLRPCTDRNIQPEPAPDCTDINLERTYWCVIYGWCPQYEVTP